MIDILCVNMRLRDFVYVKLQLQLGLKVWGQYDFFYNFYKKSYTHYEGCIYLIENKIKQQYS